MTDLEQLLAHARETAALGEVAGRLGWDQETMMPSGAAGQRAEEMAAMERVLHGRRTDPAIGEWLAAIDAPEDPAQKAMVREIARAFDRTRRVPADLATAIARATSLAQGDWVRARKAEDFAVFAPRLSEVVGLKREEASALAAGGDPYDALIEEFEPGMGAADLSAMFDALVPRLVTLRQNIKSAPQPPVLEGYFDEARQLALSAELARTFGYDMTRGRIDRAVHPFSSGSGSDVRITTRLDPADPFNCFYSTIHEVGHASYEQNVDPAYGLSPIGTGASMGVHESQSRLYENQIGRGRAFAGWLHGRMTDEFGPLNLSDPDTFHASLNRLGDGFIRTEADEVSYNLHVALRFRLERDLIAGKLAVADLEEAWNTLFLQDFGLHVSAPSLGVLQDIHWSHGAFGYFPTYTLGNVYAGCLFKALQADLPALDSSLAAGDTGQATAWLRRNLQRHGALRSGHDTIVAATGTAPGPEPLLDYLEAKFTAIYGM